MISVILRMPYRYLSKDATESDKAIYEFYKGKADLIAQGVSTSVVLPSERDPETRERLFDIEIKEIV